MNECQTCKWFVELDLNYGECHAKAPVGGISLNPKAEDGEDHLYLVCWPVVPGNDTCGDHLEAQGLGDILAARNAANP